MSKLYVCGSTPPFLLIIKHYDGKLVISMVWDALSVKYVLNGCYDELHIITPLFEFTTRDNRLINHVLSTIDKLFKLSKCFNAKNEVIEV